MLFLSSDLLYYTTSALKCQYIETAEKAGQFPTLKMTQVFSRSRRGERKNDIKAILPPNGGKCRKKHITLVQHRTAFYRLFSAITFKPNRLKNVHISQNQKKRSNSQTRQTPQSFSPSFGRKNAKKNIAPPNGEDNKKHRPRRTVGIITQIFSPPTAWRT